MIIPFVFDQAFCPAGRTRYDRTFHRFV